MRKLIEFCLAVMIVVTSLSSSAQVATGLYVFGTFDNKGFDTINVGNLNVMFNVPILAKAGRAGMNFTYQLAYNSAIWTPVGTSGSQTWTPAQNWGWLGQTEALTGYSSEFQRSVVCPGTRTPYDIISNYVYHDAFGVAHAWRGTARIPIEACPGNTDTLTNTYSTDGKYELTDKGIVDSHGVVINPPLNTTSGVGSYTDSNGNEITTDGSGNFKDTTGNIVLSVSGGAPNPEVFTYKDTNGSSQTIQVTYSIKSIQTNFGCSGVSEYANSSVPLITAITYPDGSSYQFTYEQTPDYPVGVTTGRIASVILPTGGHITYTYSGGNNGIVCADGSTATLTRKLTDDPAESQWIYAHSVETGSAQTTVTDGLNNNTTYAFVPAGTDTPTQYIETDRNVYQGSNPGTLLLTRETCYNAVAPDCSSQSVTTPISQVDTYDNLNGIQERDSTAKYNSYGLQTEEENYDFGPPSQRGSLLRYEIWTYPTSGILGLVQSDTVYDGGGNTTRETTYRYDETTPVASSGVPQHVAESGPRGNLTSLIQYAFSNTSYTTTYTYEDTGSLLTSVSPTTSSGATTTYSYDPTFVYNIGVQLPKPSSGVVLSSSQTYDQAYTGLPKVFTDPNTKPTTVESYDNMLRPTEIDYPDGGGKTTVGYSPTQIGMHRSIDSSTSTDTEIQYDGYGRLSRVAVYNGNANNNLDWYQQDTCYDADGRVDFKSYRYQASGFAYPKICSGAGDKYNYDALGRVISITHQDGTSIQYSYLGRATKATDENQISRIIQVDGLGRTAAVCEVSATTYESDSPSTCPNFDIPGTGFLTTYAYVGTKVTVTQGAQMRDFATDWLGRPTGLIEPEAHVNTDSTYYSYAVNSTGPVVARTRPQANQSNPANETTTTTQYDALGRVLSITYSDGTPTKEFSYDSNAGWGMTQTNLKGRLSAASVFNSSTQITGSAFSYDNNGRVTDMWECLPSGCENHSLDKHLIYAYDWAGEMLTSTDGAGVQATYTYSPADELEKITSSLSDATHPATLVSAVQNGPDGPLSWQLGNGLYGVRSYDSIGRNNGGWLCSGTTQQYCNGGGQTYGYTVNWSGTHVTQICDTVLNRCSQYTYDDLNRLGSQTVTAGSPDNFTYIYDRYGNRWQQNGDSGLTPSFIFDKATNQIVDSPCPSAAHICYDAAGNMTSNGFHTFTYDADGNVTAVDGGSTATYTYNAMNQRVRIDQSGSDSEEFAFNLNGQRVSIWDPQTGGEYQGQNYWGAAPVEFYQDGYAQFQHQDYLGTERMRTSYNGAVDGTFTSLPFGDGYSASGNDHDVYHFAMLDHDAASDTDHAEFRQYESTQGRWMSPDPYSGSYDFSNPQSMNRYSYVLNNPLVGVDPSGLKNPILRLCFSQGCFGGDGPGPGYGSFWYNDLDLLDFGTSLLNPNGFAYGEPPDYRSIDAFDLAVLGIFNPFAAYLPHAPSNGCSAALKAANRSAGGVGRANAAWSILQTAANANGIPTALLAAIGVRETDFMNVQERLKGGGIGPGMGVFQLTNQPGVSAAQAFNLPFAANYAASMLSSNMSYLSSAFSFTSSQLLQATAASYNFGTGNISGNPNTIDVGTTGGNYGSTVIGMMSCFSHP